MEFELINTFRRGDMTFELYKNSKGQYKTVSFVQGSYAHKEEIYENFDELYRVFSHELTKEELLGQ